MPNDNLPTVRVGMAPASLAEAMKFSEIVANSDMVPAQFKGKPGNVLVAIQWGAEVGLGPLQALQNIAVINGRPSIFGDAALALVRGSPVCVDVIEMFDRGDGSPDRFMAICTAKRKGAEPVVRTFSVGDAKKAGLWGKQGPWQTYPKRMLQQRARGFALRDAFPDVLRGVITVEEAQDIPGPDGAKNVTPAMPARMELADEPPIETASAPAAVAPDAGERAEPARAPVTPPEPTQPDSAKAPAAELKDDRALDHLTQIDDATDNITIMHVRKVIAGDDGLFPPDRDELLRRCDMKATALKAARAGR